MLQRFIATAATTLGLVFLEFEIYPWRSKPADSVESQRLFSASVS